MPRSKESRNLCIRLQAEPTSQKRAFKVLVSTLQEHTHFFDEWISPAHTPLLLYPDLKAFNSLLLWVNGSRDIKLNRIVPFCEAAHHFKMDSLFEMMLERFRNNLYPLMLSGIQLEKLHGDVQLRLLSAVTDKDLAIAMLAMYKNGSSKHPNRKFLTSLHHHYLLNLVHGLPSAGSMERSIACDSSVKEKDLSKRNSAVEINRKSGLRWCENCNCLFNFTELCRVVSLHKRDDPQCPGPQGAITFSLPAKCGGKYASTSCLSDPRGAAPRKHTPAPVDWSLTALQEPALPTEVEAVLWSIIGTSRFLVCDHCSRVVALVDVPYHGADPNDALSKQSFSSPGATSNCIAPFIEWYCWCYKNAVYQKEGGIRALMEKPSNKKFAVVPEARKDIRFDAVRPLLAHENKFPIVEMTESDVVDLDILNDVERRERMQRDAGAHRASSTPLLKRRLTVGLTMSCVSPFLDVPPRATT